MDVCPVQGGKTGAGVTSHFNLAEVIRAVLPSDSGHVTHVSYLALADQSLEPLQRRRQPGVAIFSSPDHRRQAVSEHQV